MNLRGWEVQSWPGLFTDHRATITSLWLLVAHSWKLRLQPYEPGMANLSQNKSQETGVRTVLCPSKPSPSTSPSAILPPIPFLLCCRLCTPARHPQPALPSTLRNTPTHKEQLKEMLAACPERDPGWLPALGSHAAAAARSDAPTVPRLALFLGCLNVPVANVSLVSALISVPLKM